MIVFGRKLSQTYDISINQGKLFSVYKTYWKSKFQSSTLKKYKLEMEWDFLRWILTEKFQQCNKFFILFKWTRPKINKTKGITKSQEFGCISQILSNVSNALISRKKVAKMHAAVLLCNLGFQFRKEGYKIRSTFGQKSISSK